MPARARRRHRRHCRRRRRSRRWPLRRSWRRRNRNPNRPSSRACSRAMLRPRRGDVLWLMVRQAFLQAPGASTLGGGCLAYTAATLFFSLILLKPGAWGDVKGMKRQNLPWFLSSALLVAVSQAFVYASLAAAPLMVVTPI